MAGCEPLALGLSWKVWKETAPLGRGDPLPPHEAPWEAHRLTYWKGRRMARISPLKKRVMSSTKSTPWQEVKSNCRDGAGVSCRAPHASTVARHPGAPAGQHAGQKAEASTAGHWGILLPFPRWPSQTLLIPLLLPNLGSKPAAPHPVCLPLQAQN